MGGPWRRSTGGTMELSRRMRLASRQVSAMRPPGLSSERTFLRAAGGADSLASAISGSPVGGGIGKGSGRSLRWICNGSCSCNRSPVERCELSSRWRSTFSGTSEGGLRWFKWYLKAPAVLFSAPSLYMAALPASRVAAWWFSR